MTEVHKLIERARYDLERGWVSAAQDALGRAVRMLDEVTERFPSSATCNEARP